MTSPQPLASLAFAVAAGLLTALPVLARDTDMGVSATEIRIGMVNAQSGPAGGLGQSMRQGTEAVFKEINSQGGVHGRRLSLRVADDGYEPERTATETLRLAQEEAVFSFLGFVGTPTANAALPLIRELEVPVIGIVSGAQSMRVPVTRQVFNIRASYDDETEALVGLLFDKGARSVGVVHQFDGFGLSVLSGTERALKRRGATVSATGTFQRNTTAIRSALGAMLETQPEVVVLAGTYEPVAAFIKAARAAGLKSRFATVSFVGTSNLLGLLGEEGEGLVISQVVPFPDDDTVAITRECRRLLARHEGAALNFLNFEGCIGAQVLVKALQSAGAKPSRAAVIEALESMRRIDLGGMPVVFDASNHQASNDVYLTQVRKGAITKIR